MKKKLEKKQLKNLSGAKGNIEGVRSQSGQMKGQQARKTVPIAIIGGARRSSKNAAPGADVVE